MTDVASQPNDFLPTASLEVLEERDRLLRRIRSFFHQRDFIEVTTPTLSRDTVIDRHLDPYAAQPYDNAGGQVGRFLQTSPEFHMKRLLAAGAERIFQIGPAFRVGEMGRLHNPEFTMVEWYRVGDELTAGINLLCDLAQCTLDAPVVQVSYREAFLEHAKIDPFQGSLASLRHNVAISANRGPAPDASTLDADGCLEWIFVDQIQPSLQMPTIVYDYPATQAALAKTRRNKDGIEVAERFELFARGIELANGYHELLDAGELVRRSAENNRLRVSDGKQPLPENSRLVDAMQHGLPACAGVALGFDRLLLLTTDCQVLNQVIAFPFDRA